MIANRILIACAGLAGASGVTLAAAAAHLGGGNVGTASDFLLFHAPAILVLALLGRGKPAVVAGFLMVVGVALFSGDLVLRTYVGTPLFRMAAPAGGTILIGAWLLTAALALLPATDLLLKRDRE